MRDRGSQHALYRLFYGYGMSISIRYVKTEDEAMTVVNDSFLKVFRNIRSYDSQKPFKPWFRKIVANTAITHLKSQQRFKVEISMEHDENTPANEDVLSQIAYRELIALVQSLSVAYRTVFNMYVIDGYSHKEIAKSLGITESTSKANLTRARAKLRELILAKIGM